MADDNLDDILIPYVEFADNANERTPCVLVLDCSGSMRGGPIDQLNQGLKALEHELKEDIDASCRITSYNVCYTKLLRILNPLENSPSYVGWY